MSRTSTDGLVVIPDFEQGWIVDEQVAGGSTPVTMLKCKRTAPNNELFVFVIAKQYEVPAGQTVNAEVLTNSIYRAIYEKNFQRVQVASTEWVENDGVRWYQASIELTHSSRGVISKVERVHVKGSKVFLVSAEGRKDDIGAHHSFVQRWLNECRFSDLAAAVPPPSPEAELAVLERTPRVDFDRLSKRSFAEGSTREDKDALWKATFALKEWLFVARGTLPNVAPYIASNPSVADGRPMLKAFTESAKLQRFAVANGLTKSSEDVEILAIPIAGAVAFAEQFAAHGVTGIHFNADLESDGFFSPLAQLAIIKRHLDGLPEAVADDSAEGAILGALRRVADGGSAPELTIFWLWEPSPMMATVLSIGGDGSVHRGSKTTKLKERERVGHALADEVKTLAAEIVASGFPNLALPPGHPAVPPTIPPVQCTVTHGAHRLAVHVPASELSAVPGLDRIRSAVRAVESAVEKRKGGPVIVTDDPVGVIVGFAGAAVAAVAAATPPAAAPPPPPPPKQAPDGSRSPLFAPFLELVNGRVSWPVVFQRLAEHRGYWAPAVKLPNGSVAPQLIANGPRRSVLAFTAEPPLDAWIFAGNRADAYMKDAWGMSLFGDLPDDVNAVELDCASPLPLRLHDDAVAGLRRAARGVQALHALANLADRSLTRLAVRYDGYRALLQWQRGAATPLTLPDAQGRPFAVVVTSDLALESYLAVWPHLRSMLVPSAWMDGALCFRQVPSLGVAGVVVNPHTPGMTAIPVEACAAIAASVA